MISEILPWPLYSLFHVEDSEPPTRNRSLSNLLRHYETPGVSPPSSRVDPHLVQQSTQPFRLGDAWKYGAVIASKATAITADIISHSIWGPRKKSWGLQMTIITSVMRDIGQHSALIDIATIRMLMGLGGLVPLPSDALVTPVTFRVKRRKLKGILAEFDRLEDGSRELSGEWVMGKKLWQRLQAEWKGAQKSKSDDKPKDGKERVVLYLHGGAYYTSSSAAQRLISIPLSKYTDARVFALDYRLAPEAKFPSQLHDAASGYFRLTEDLHIPPENIILTGDSAGGGLTLALMMYLRDNQYPMPSCAILMSPWVDLTMSCDSWESNAEFDILPIPTPGDHLNPIGLYLGTDIEKYLTHPYASPLFGDFKGLPPMLIQAGDSEVLRDEIALLAHKATQAGVDVQHELYEDCVHVFQAIPFVDASRRAFEAAQDFVQHVLPRIQSRSPKALERAAQMKLETEIDSENVRIVRGDGVETASGRQDVEEEMKEDEEEAAKTPMDDARSEFSSWGRSRSSSFAILSPMSISPTLDRQAKTPEDGNIGPGNMRRIQSALAAYASDAPASRTHHHKRTPSAQTTYRPGYTKRFTGQLSMANMDMSTFTTPTPSPAIRRKTASHPDMASLVAQFTQSGPANHTTMYKPTDTYLDTIPA